MPFDPVTPDNALKHARSANEAIRALNQATMPADGSPALRYPSDAYALIGSIAEMSSRLPQLFEQVAAFLERQLQFDLVRVDGGEFDDDPLGAIGTTSDALLNGAIPSAQRTAGALMRAHQVLAFATVNDGATPPN